MRPFSCRKALRISLAAPLLAVLGGCGVQGPLTPRRPEIPLPVTDLAAQQRGDSVILSFSLPQNSTQQQPLGERPSVDVYRSAPAAASRGGKKTALQPVSTIPGDQLAQYEINGRVEVPVALDPTAVARQPGQQLTYTVRTSVEPAHPSASSNAVTVSVYPAPEPINDLHAMITESAILLSWTPPQRGAGEPGGSLAGYRVYRAEILQGPAAAAATALQSVALGKPASPPELAASPMSPGFQDMNFSFDHTYVYTVRSVARYGNAILESADSNAVTVTPKDVFPPATPEGLEAVVVPATQGTQAYVELSWNISTEPDFAGYTVYRSEQPDSEGMRLNSELLASPTFRDLAVVPGHRYYYRIGAVDRSGNESPRSPAVPADLPAQ